jgi:hypothetical protein
MMRLLYFFICVLLLKLVINLSKYIRAKRYLSKYWKWLAKGDTKLLEHKTQVIKILKDAGVEDALIGSVELVGYGYVRTGNASTFENFPNARQDVAHATVRMFHQAIGVYRSRMFETFNPLYWIEAIINLPKQTLVYLGLPSESIVIKIAQLVWWIVGVAFGFVYALYKPELEAAVKSWITRITS